MTDQKARLTLSRDVLYGWQQSGGPAGKPEDVLRMIREEVAILEAMKDECREAAESIELLIDGYQRLANQVRTRMN